MRALGAGGPEALRVEALAQALGVRKGGFSWYFGDRGAILAQMLDTRHMDCLRGLLTTSCPDPDEADPNCHRRHRSRA